MGNSFENKVVIVTGAGGAIGRAAAIGFAREGAAVTVSELDESSGAETVAQIERIGGRAMLICGDISNKEHVEFVVGKTVEHFGGLDCAFNNAGIIHPDDASWNESSFRRTLEINVISQFLCMTAQIPAMLARGGGAIVNTSSTTGLVGQGLPALPGYSASKHAVIGLSKTAALAYARQNIRVNALCPGTTLTAMVEKLMAGDEAMKAQIESYAPIGRLARPEEIADCAIWLCSDKASYVTGHALVADGGFLAQ